MILAFKLVLSTSISFLAACANKLNSSTMNNVVLSNESKNLISSTVGGTELKFNVAYNGKGNNDYVNKYYNVETPNVYKTTVTYTIEAQ